MALDVKNKLKKFAIEKFLYNLLVKGDGSDKAKLVKALKLAHTFAPKCQKHRVKAIIEMAENDHPAIGLMRRIIENVHVNYKKATLNFILKGLLENSEKRKQADDKGDAIPTTVLISPTMRCNIKCIGCYASEYSMKDDLPFDVFQRVVNEAKEMGIAFFTILGGEPLLRKDLFTICKENPDAVFQVYTNGTLIDEKIADKFLECGNILPILSIEGFEKETDARRGKGIYKNLMKVMDILKSKGIPFGFSVAVTKLNEEKVASDEFVDMMLKKGAYIGWHFLYMPVGRSPDLSLMPSPKQRLHLLRHIENMRKTKPIFLVDFWNDAPHVGGCIAGKHYAHITSKGDVEPCIFSHFAQSNIKDVSLMEAMNSPFFKFLRSKQPYNDNLFLPCMWIDNPEISREFHEKFPDVYPTHNGADDILKQAAVMKGIDKYSKEVKATYKEVWKEMKEKGIKIYQ